MRQRAAAGHVSGLTGGLVSGLAVALLAGSLTASAGDLCPDDDGDGYSPQPNCGTAIDCNDADAASFPDAPEPCDGIDNDCNGLADDSGLCIDLCLTPNTAIAEQFTQSAGVPSAPSLAWTGAGFGVAWHETAPGGERVVFVRLDAAGRPVGPEVELEAASQARGASVVWTGSEFGVAWWSNATGSREISFARLDEAGQPVGDITRVTTDPSAAYWPSLVWTGAEYGVAWFDDRSGVHEVFFTRLDPSGLEIGDDVPITSAGGSFPTLAWNGSEYGLAWAREPGGPLAQFVRLDTGGAVMGTETTVAAGRPSVLKWNGTEYGLLWRDPVASDEVRFSRLDAQGIPVDAGTLVIDGMVSGTSPALAWIGSRYGLAWISATGTAPSVRYGSMIAAGAMPAEVIFVTDSPAARSTALAWTGEHFAFVWLGEVGAGAELYFSQVFCECNDADGDGFSNCDECDDGDPSVNPLGMEIGCDGLDNDCDDATPDFVDEDEDGFICGADCVDSNPSVTPDNPCPSLDASCNPIVEPNDCDLDGLQDECEARANFKAIWLEDAVWPARIHAADLDGDGDLDPIAASPVGDLPWFVNDGSGNIGARRFVTWGGGGSVWPVDFDGDGDIDLVGDSDDRVAWVENLNGTGTFSSVRIISLDVAVTASAVFPVDLDGDGDLDVLYTSESQSVLAWYENHGQAASFGTRQVIESAAYPFIRGADLDGDGDNDVLGGSSGSGVWFENLDGAGTFGPQREIFPGGDRAAIADLDGDGDLDVAAAPSDSLNWYRNDGSGNFSTGLPIQAGHIWYVLAADIDGDADNDLLSVRTSGDQIVWYENLDGGGQFATPIEIYANNLLPQDVAIADLDRDGDQDLLLAFVIQNHIRWFRNDAEDCNGNSVPDSCDPDCNGNGVADECEIRSASSFDCNTNNVPDECEVMCADACGDSDRCVDDFDCDPTDASIWAAPGSARKLRLSLEPQSTTLKWLPPRFAGANAIRYDAIVSGSASDLAAATCLEANQTNTIAMDTATLQSGELVYYLIRVENDCPGQGGTLGTRSDGTERIAPDCP